MATINFASTAKKSSVSTYAITVIFDILNKSNNHQCEITSTSRTPEEQARIMFNNCAAHGSESQLHLYKQPGQEVIMIYRQMIAGVYDRQQIINAMASKIKEIGPSKVSLHCSDITTLNVVDIAPSSIINKTAFISAVSADKRISKFLQPPLDPAYHLEIPIK